MVEIPLSEEKMEIFPMAQQGNVFEAEGREGGDTNKKARLPEGQRA